MTLQGKAYYCGDYVNTDVMSPGRFEPFEGPEHLARVALIDYEGAVPFVRSGESKSDYLVIFAGMEFGCGSSRETAPQALHHAGVRIVVARSFARIFYRNCINMGLLLPIQLDHKFGEGVIGKTVTFDVPGRTFTVEGETFTFPDFGPVQRIIEAGGLTALNKQMRQKGQTA